MPTTQWLHLEERSQVVFGIISIFLNTLLMYLILAKSPPRLGSYRWLMLYTSFFELVYAFVNLFAGPTVHTFGSAFIVLQDMENFYFTSHKMAFLAVVTYCSCFGFSMALFGGHFIYRYGAVDIDFHQKYLRGARQLLLYIFPFLYGILWGVICWFWYGETPERSNYLSILFYLLVQASTWCIDRIDLDRHQHHHQLQSPAWHRTNSNQPSWIPVISTDPPRHHPCGFQLSALVHLNTSPRGFHLSALIHLGTTIVDSSTTTDPLRHKPSWIPVISTDPPRHHPCGFQLSAPSFKHDWTPHKIGLSTTTIRTDQRRELFSPFSQQHQEDSNTIGNTSPRPTDTRHHSGPSSIYSVKQTDSTMFPPKFQKTPPSTSTHTTSPPFPPEPNLRLLSIIQHQTPEDGFIIHSSGEESDDKQQHQQQLQQQLQQHSSSSSSSSSSVSNVSNVSRTHWLRTILFFIVSLKHPTSLF